MPNKESYFFQTSESTIKIIIFFLFFSSATFPLYSVSPIGKRVQAHLSIGDPQSAKEEIGKALLLDPDNLELLRLQIHSLSAMHDIPALLQAWHHFCEIKKDDLDRQLLEEISWAIIRKSSMSNSPVIRFEGMLAAFFSNDVRGISICLQSLQDASVSIRSVAVGLVAEMHDEVLQKEVVNLFLNDDSPDVRTRAMATLGQMRVKDSLGLLQEVLASDNSSLEEKEVAIEAIADIVTKVDFSMIEQLSKSKRAFLRVLACQLILDQLDDTSLQFVQSCVNDPSPDVRLLAIQSLGIIVSVKKENSVSSALIQPLVDHPHVETAIAANWLLFMVGNQAERALAEEKLRKWLFSPNPRVRLLAVASLGATGSQGLFIANDVMNKSSDPLVRINLAIYMIWQRNELLRASQVIAKDLAAISDRLSWGKFGIFSYVDSNCRVHVEGCERVPEIIDLQTRLDLYSMLATCDYNQLHDILKSFLRERTWGITGQAASLMVQEGLETLEAMRDLLFDPAPAVSMQAAFILAFYSQDQEALKILEQQYTSSSRVIKERILYAIGSIGSPTALPFLVQVLDEPFESLRVSAARAILLCLSR